MADKTYQSKVMGLLLILMLVLVACGGDGGTGNNTDNNASSSDGDEAPATSTPFPTFAFVAPTNPPVFNQDAESTDEADPEATESPDAEDTVDLDPTMVARGMGRYEALECAECHGENGEGVDDVIGLVDMELSLDAFITYMRTGGDIGSSHQYSTDRLSENGARNLYQYVLSLGD